MAAIGSSYGGYLCALVTTLRPVRWLALRAPALYKDAEWTSPKQLLNRQELTEYRRNVVKPTENRALAACADFEGDVLLVESEHDNLVPPTVTANYRAAFQKARSTTVRVLKGADHALSEQKWQDAYTSLLASWGLPDDVAGLERLDQKVDQLPPISPNPGESTTDYFIRQQENFNDAVVPLTLDVIRETFAIAAIVCLIAIVVVSRMRTDRDSA